MQFPVKWQSRHQAVRINDVNEFEFRNIFV